MANVYITHLIVTRALRARYYHTPIFSEDNQREEVSGQGPVNGKVRISSPPETRTSNLVPTPVPVFVSCPTSGRLFGLCRLSFFNLYNGILPASCKAGRQ